MTYNITITIPVKGLADEESAQDCASNMIQHLEETFNDDGSLDIDHASLRVTPR